MDKDQRLSYQCALCGYRVLVHKDVVDRMKFIEQFLDVEGSIHHHRPVVCKNKLDCNRRIRRKKNE